MVLLPLRCRSCDKCGFMPGGAVYCRTIDARTIAATLPALNFPRKILMLAERFPPEIGGSARSAARTAAALAVRWGSKLTCFAGPAGLPSGRARKPPTSAAGGIQTGVTLHRLGLYANWDLSLQHTLNVLDWLHETRKFDCVWGHYLYPAGFLAVLFAKSAGLACTVSARGNDVDRLVFPPGDFARLLWTLEHADLITAASHNLAKKINVLLARDGGVQVVHNSVDVDLLLPRTARSRVAGEDWESPPMKRSSFSPASFATRRAWIFSSPRVAPRRPPGAPPPACWWSARRGPTNPPGWQRSPPTSRTMPAESSSPDILKTPPMWLHIFGWPTYSCIHRCGRDCPTRCWRR